MKKSSRLKFFSMESDLKQIKHTHTTTNIFIHTYNEMGKQRLNYGKPNSTVSFDLPSKAGGDMRDMYEDHFKDTFQGKYSGAFHDTYEGGTFESHYAIDTEVGNLLTNNEVCPSAFVERSLFKSL